jgi:hypothetical protein
MPKGPQGQKRPADVVGGAIKVARISVGDEPDDRQDAPTLSPGAQLGKLGGAARARNMTPEQRSEAAKKAATGRWQKKSQNK